MANNGEFTTKRGMMPWRIVGWGTAALLLLLPLVAMQFTEEVRWSPGDFIFAALMFGTVGAAFELTIRSTRNWAYRAGVACALGASFLIVWAGGAVGMIGDEDNPYNLLFLGVIVVALVGSVVARFRARGMAVAMGVAALAHIGLAVGGMFTDLRGGIFSALMAGAWVLAAALFGSARSDQSGAA